LHREGFRGLVLLPTPRDRLLLGKNLSLLPLATALAVSRSRWPSLGQADGAGGAGHGPAICRRLPAFLRGGKSVFDPRPVSRGCRFAQAHQTELANHAGFVWRAPAIPGIHRTDFCSTSAGLVAGLSAGYRAERCNCDGSPAVAVLVVLYKFTLSPLGRLMQRREQKILRAVTEVME